MDEATAKDETKFLPQRLIEGYETFLRVRLPREQGRYRHLADHGQSPKILLIGCCDSRTAPEVIFDADPGELFVVRNIAALVPPYAPDGQLHGTSAALEFSVKVLKVSHIVIMGHAMCGGVRAYADTQAGKDVKLAPDDFLGQWISLIGLAAAKIPPRTEPVADYAERLGKAAVIQSIGNLRTFPYVRAAEQAGKLALHGAYFGIADGRLLALDAGRGTFVPMAAAAHAAALSTPRF